ncbi:hypothetical protein SCA6_009408 [Theobroma cacao]
MSIMIIWRDKGEDEEEEEDDTDKDANEIKAWHSHKFGLGEKENQQGFRDCGGGTKYRLGKLQSKCSGT